jgi:hypothetical protein
VRRFFAVLVLFAIVPALLAEVVLRLSGVWIGRHSDTMHLLMQHDDVLGWRMKPNLSATYDFVDVEGVSVRSNGLGFADEEFETAPPPDRCRIVLLGDSFTWGAGVREAQRFGNRLGARAPEWETLNFGMSAWGTDQSLLAWRRLASRYRPDLVVLTIFENDYLENLSSINYGFPKPFFVLGAGGELELQGVPVEATHFWEDGILFQIAPPYASRIEPAVVRRSTTLHWLAKNSELVRSAYTLWRAWWYEQRDVPAEPAAGQALTPGQELQVEVLGALVRRLAAEVGEAGAAFAVMFAGAGNPAYVRQQQEFRRDGIAFLDATAARLAERLPAGEVILYRYSGHWTPAANGAAAELLAAGIRERGLCAGAERRRRGA